MNYAQRIAAELDIRAEQAAATIALFDAGNTLPFIARYRKEQTGMLDEQQLRRLKKLLERKRLACRTSTSPLPVSPRKTSTRSWKLSQLSLTWLTLRSAPSRTLACRSRLLPA